MMIGSKKKITTQQQKRILICGITESIKIHSRNRSQSIKTQFSNSGHVRKYITNQKKKKLDRNVVLLYKNNVTQPISA